MDKGSGRHLGGQCMSSHKKIHHLQKHKCFKIMFKFIREIEMRTNGTEGETMTKPKH